jgi:hypothetical protein
MLLLLCCAARTFAQTNVSAPHGALFGPGDDRAARHKLDLSFSLTEAYDDNAPRELQFVGAADTLFGGYSTMFNGSADYRLAKPRVQFGATAASTIRYFNEIDEFRSTSHTGAVGFNARLTDRTTLLVNQTVAYAPSYFYGLFPYDAAQIPGEAIPAAPDYAINDYASYNYGTTLSLTQSLSPRNRLSAGGDFQRTDFIKETNGQSDLSTRGVHGEFSRNVSRNTAVHAGYRYRTGTFGSFNLGTGNAERGSTSEHGLDVGMNYSRPLSATRRLTFGASVGTSAVNVPDFLVDAVEVDRVYRASSEMSIAWESRAWQMRGMYHRGLEYVAQLRQPVFVDGFAGDFNALITRRVNLSAGARYSSGASALLRDTLTLDTYSADVQMRYALTRNLAAYGEYLYYFYDFQGNTQLAPGVPRGLERNGVRAGLTLWVPAFRR